MITIDGEEWSEEDAAILIEKVRNDELSIAEMAQAFAVSYAVASACEAKIARVMAEAGFSAEEMAAQGRLLVEDAGPLVDRLYEKLVA